MVELAFTGNLSYQAVATYLGLPNGTVKTGIRAGIRHLQAALGTDEQ